MNDTVTVKCQFCGELFLMERPIIISERDRATCPACRKVAKRNTARMKEDIASEALEDQR